MAIRTFSGGIHPPENKEYSRNKPIIKAPLPDVAYVLISQNTGKPPVPIVEKGTPVKTGQKIAEAQGALSVPLHSPLTGKVVDIKKVFHPVTQKSEDAIVIQRESEDQYAFLSPLAGWESYDHEKRSDSLYNRIFEAGIVGMGGATFPAHFKYIEAMKKPADYVILNGAECEPYLTIDEQLMIECPKEIIRGLEILLALTGAGKGFIGIEDNKPEAFAVMQKHQSEKIETVLLKTKYPQGGEKQLIYSITKRTVPNGGYPINIGVIVNNVATAFAIYEAVEKGKPLYERGLSVTGEGIRNPNNYLVRIGTPVQQLIELAGGLKEPGNKETQADSGKVILGGPMMGIPVKDLSVPIMKGTSGILCLPPDKVHEIEEMPCINCGMCLFSCSLKLEPNYLVKLVKAKKFDEAYKYGVLNCCECGSCAYVCPSKIEHVKHFKLAKKLYTTLKGGKK